MDRRHIQNVEAHLRDVIQPGDAVTEGAGFLRIARAGSRKHFVPRAEPRFLAVHAHRQLLFISSGRAPIRIPLHQRGQLGAASGGHRCAQIAGRELGQFRGEIRQASRVGSRRALRGVLREVCANAHVQRHILPRLVFFDEPANPALEGIDPRLDTVEVGPLQRDPELALPAVVIHEPHRGFAPVIFGIGPIQQHRAERVVPVDENIRLDHHVLAHGSLDGKPSRIDFRGDAFDGRAANGYQFLLWGFLFRLDFRGRQVSPSEKNSQTF
jgi:hypothetical protein